MPGTFPQMTSPTGFEWTSLWPGNRRTVAHSGRILVRSNNAHRWQLTLSYPQMLLVDAQRIQAFFNRQHGSFDTFEYSMPHRNQLGSLGGTPRVTQTTLAGITDVNTTGWPPNRRVLRAGDRIRFQHSKVYQLFRSAISDGAGNATLEIEPGLIQTVSGNELLVTSGLTYRMGFQSDSLVFQTVSYQYYQTTFSLEERY